tara:strand:- start:4109 stop:4321 length:213 start_codon:yes stop_codon:yes gene_type:complete
MEYNLVANIKDLNENYKIKLPWIGSFVSFINSFKESNLFDRINELVTIDKVPILRICVGVQSFFEKSEEG